ncbi:LptF/LptG family permease [candidate division KSB1 bacterium]
MKKIDRYISSIFIQILIFSVISFILIFVIVDLISNIDKFLNKNVPLVIVVKYYIFYLPYILVLILPAAVLIASLFSVGQLARRNELVAFKASGVSLYRITAPLLTVAFIVSVFSLLFTEYVVPVTSGKKLDIDRKYIRQVSEARITQSRNLYFEDIENRFVTIQYYDGARKKATSVNITYQDNETIKNIIQAKKMIWQDSLWILNEVSVRSFINGVEEMNEFSSLPMEDFSFNPDDLLDIWLKPEEMNFFQLKRFIERRRELGVDVRVWLVELMLKISFPFANFIIVLFGVPLVSKGTRSGGAIGFGIALVICFFFFGTVRIGQYLGRADMMNPVLSAWIGNIIFATIGLFLLFKSRK